ncbi:MAG: hypothetical protein ACK4JE_00545 [Endomicrobiia bacterium]
MEEKILLLMEETGCDEGEAQLALELANNNFEKAIYTIKSLLRNITVIKGKFYIEEKNLYGLFVIIFDKRSKNIIRFTSVASYNPTIYTTDIYMDWHLLEKSIYNFRLLEGSVPSLTREIESYFTNEISSKKESLYKAIINDDIKKIHEIFIEIFPYKEPKIQITNEDINLAQYEQENAVTKSDIKNSRAELLNTDTKKLYLETKILENPEGKKAKSLFKNEIVFAKIIDDREIAKYLSRLLGSKEMDYIPVPVEDIKKSGEDILIKLYFTPGIGGYAKLKPYTKVSIAKEIQKPFWKRILGVK